MFLKTDETTETLALVLKACSEDKLMYPIIDITHDGGALVKFIPYVFIEVYSNGCVMGYTEDNWYSLESITVQTIKELLNWMGVPKC